MDKSMKICILENITPLYVSEYLHNLWLLLSQDQIYYEVQYRLLRALVLIVSDKVHCQLVDIILLVTKLIMLPNLCKSCDNSRGGSGMGKVRYTNIDN